MIRRHSFPTAGGVYRPFHSPGKRDKGESYMSSLWSENTVLPAFPALEGDVSTDVLIIGGGMAGLLCALLLKQQGVSCVVAEASRICSGATKNTTAKITAHHGLIYSRLLREKGEEKARMYLIPPEAGRPLKRKPWPSKDWELTPSFMKPYPSLFLPVLWSFLIRHNSILCVL